MIKKTKILIGILVLIVFIIFFFLFIKNSRFDPFLDERCKWESGPCEALIRAGYYFNMDTGKCEYLGWGYSGCRSPPFKYMEECESICVRKVWNDQTIDVPPPGGDCFYKEFSGICKVTSILNQGRIDRSIIVNFTFEPIEELDLEGTHMERDRVYITEKTHSLPVQHLGLNCIRELNKNPYQLEIQDLENCGIVIGNEFNCQVEVITRGGCSPINFRFYEDEK